MCDIIVVLKDGYISEMGGYSDLLSKQGAFSELMEHFQQEYDSNTDSSDGTEGKTESIFLTDSEF